jgi:hypothetical protein
MNIQFPNIHAPSTPTDEHVRRALALVARDNAACAALFSYSFDALRTSPCPHGLAFDGATSTLYVAPHAVFEPLDMAHVTPAEAGAAGGFHPLFARRASLLQPSALRVFCDALEATDVVFCGHGAGGAVAVVAALQWLCGAAGATRVLCVTFGAPSVASADIASRLGAHVGAFVNYVHEDDVVPSLVGLANGCAPGCLARAVGTGEDNEVLREALAAFAAGSVRPSAADWTSVCCVAAVRAQCLSPFVPIGACVTLLAGGSRVSDVMSNDALWAAMGHAAPGYGTRARESHSVDAYAANLGLAPTAATSAQLSPMQRDAVTALRRAPAVTSVRVEVTDALASRRGVTLRIGGDSDALSLVRRVQISVGGRELSLVAPTEYDDDDDDADVDKAVLEAWSIAHAADRGCALTVEATLPPYVDVQADANVTVLIETHYAQSKQSDAKVVPVKGGGAEAFADVGDVLQTLFVLEIVGGVSNADATAVERELESALQFSPLRALVHAVGEEEARNAALVALEQHVKQHNDVLEPSFDVADELRALSVCEKYPSGNVMLGAAAANGAMQKGAAVWVSAAQRTENVIEKVSAVVGRVEVVRKVKRWHGRTKNVVSYVDKWGVVDKVVGQRLVDGSPALLRQAMPWIGKVMNIVAFVAAAHAVYRTWGNGRVIPLPLAVRGGVFYDAASRARCALSLAQTDFWSALATATPAARCGTQRLSGATVARYFVDVAEVIARDSQRLMGLRGAAFEREKTRLDAYVFARVTSASAAAALLSALFDRGFVIRTEAAWDKRTMQTAAQCLGVVCDAPELLMRAALALESEEQRVLLAERAATAVRDVTERAIVVESLEEGADMLLELTSTPAMGDKLGAAARCTDALCAGGFTDALPAEASGAFTADGQREVLCCAHAVRALQRAREAIDAVGPLAAIVGPKDAGKTTLVGALTGARTANAGRGAAHATQHPQLLLTTRGRAVLDVPACDGEATPDLFVDWGASLFPLVRAFVILLPYEFLHMSFESGASRLWPLLLDVARCAKAQRGVRVLLLVSKCDVMYNTARNDYTTPNAVRERVLSEAALERRKMLTWLDDHSVGTLAQTRSLRRLLAANIQFGCAHDEVAQTRTEQNALLAAGLTDGARTELLARAEQLATERTEAMRECGLWTADDVRAWLEEQ